jgi:hypothetical protein
MPASRALDEVLAANKAYRASGQHTPRLPLGVSRRLVVLTCMDSRRVAERGTAAQRPHPGRCGIAGWPPAEPSLLLAPPVCSTQRTRPPLPNHVCRPTAVPPAPHPTPTAIPNPRPPPHHPSQRRLLPEHFLGLRQGEAEVIRNGGGRVTEDVIRCVQGGGGRVYGGIGGGLILNAQPE